MNGHFISIEGGEGAGKTTLISKIEKEFTNQGLSYVLTREPGGTPLAEAIRGLLLTPPGAGEKPMPALSELFLFEAARADHVERVIRPAMAQGKQVLCDRYAHSSLAYQGYARGLGPKTVEDLNTLATGGLQPDLVIWLKIDPREGLKRVQQRTSAQNEAASRLDQEKLAFHEKVFAAFEEISKREAQRFAVIDASQSPEKVFESLAAHPHWKKLGFGR